ncbi:outer membrane beta-barrel protein [Flagellimonas olearia]|uniref:Outer membrane beta-barrel protein n=1 Tax=Flagellimonas olearia TaxID=552546 RepID=A0A6I1DYM0_9FLAO|nr:porin family protein [Allomuricauda olearia]KAB7529154.1 outer membrane beta-barrel protein [Allomuricauda olearia]
MKQYVVLTLLSFSFFVAQSQEVQDSIVDVNRRYLEDQFYIGLGYNLLFNRPENTVQRNLSYNLQAGFIKDIPLNYRRNVGLGIGVGYAVNSYYSNIVAIKTNNIVSYEVMDQADFNRSKLETHAVEFPLELRWRTSTVEEYKFWRIYAGVKLGYVFSGRSKLVMEGGSTSFSNDDIQPFQYGLMFNFGYNTWNIHAYYGLSPLLEETAQLPSGEKIDTRVLRIGLIFYIL